MIKGYLYKDEIEKARTVTTKKGREIIPFVMFDTPENEFSDYVIKEARTGDDTGSAKFEFLGNASIVIKKGE